MKPLASAAVGAALLALAFPARPANDGTALLFSISKSENRNYVQYAVHLDPTCAPVGDAPVFAFWRMLEHGPDATEPLLAREQGAYGVASQAVIGRRGGEGSVRATLRALPDSPLAIDSWRDPQGACVASARTPIAGTAARLFNVHAVLRWPFGVARLLVSGWSLSDGHPVRDARTP